MTQNNLGIAWSGLPSGDREANLRQAIACYEAALRVRTERALPQQWANTQFHLALARVASGDRQGAIEAMSCAAHGFHQVGIESDAAEAETWLRNHGANP
jgi:hypothetical protein